MYRSIALVLLALIPAATAAAQTPLSGNLSGTLTAGVYTVDSSASVASGDTLTLDPGVVIKFAANRRLTVDGTLVANGTAANPVVLTSLADDARGGDTNGDGVSAGSPGDWIGLSFGDASDASVLRFTVVSFAGGLVLTAAVDLAMADITMLDCTVEQSQRDGIDFNASSFPTIRRSAFDGCQLRPMVGVRIEALPNLRCNTASGNGGGDHALVTGFGATGNVTIFPYNYPGEALVTTNTGISVAAGSSLTLERGCRIKISFPGAVSCSLGTLDIKGTGLEPVIITSVADDEVGGDTNGDGMATVPAAGGWSGVRYHGDALASQVGHLIVRYGGFVAPGFRCDSPAVEVDSVRVEHCTSNGFHLDDAAGVVTNCVAFANGGHGFDLGNGAVSLDHATAASNGNDGITALGGYTGTISNGIAWNNAAAGIDGAIAVTQVRFTDADPAHAGANGNISQDPIFANESVGDLTLQVGSPCLNTAELPLFPTLATDFDGASRALDHDLSGATLPDMGAFERAAYDLTSAGRPETGTSMVLTVGGGGDPVAIVILLASIGVGHELYSDYGFLTIGVQSTVFFGLSSFYGLPMTIPFIDQPSLHGFPFNLQALVLQGANTTRGNFTNAYRGVIFDC